MARAPKPDLVVYRGIQFTRDRLPADVVTSEVQSLDEWRKAARVVRPRVPRGTPPSVAQAVAVPEPIDTVDADEAKPVKKAAKSTARQTGPKSTAKE